MGPIHCSYCIAWSETVTYIFSGRMVRILRFCIEFKSPIDVTTAVASRVRDGREPAADNLRFGSTKVINLTKADANYPNLVKIIRRLAE